MLQANHPLVVFFYRRLDRLRERAYLLELFAFTKTEPLALPPDAAKALAVKHMVSLPPAAIPPAVLDNDPVKFEHAGKLHYAYACRSDQDVVLRYLRPVDSESLLDIHEEVELPSGVIPNHQGKETLTTTFGLLVINYNLLVVPFTNRMPYVNETITTKVLGGIEKTISTKLLAEEFRPDEVKLFLDSLYFIGHFSEICVAPLTEKALTTDPAIAKRKQEIVKQHTPKELEDPAVWGPLETELLGMDRAWIKGDPSERFYAALGNTAYDVARKKMYVTVGAVQSFDPSKEWDFIANSLEEGWQASRIPALCNETRRGSYDRGVETQKGGAQTKFIMRIFQDLKIVEDDCGSPVGLTVDFSQQPLEKFLGRYMMQGKGITLIDKAVAKTLENKTVTLRSPMYCRTKNGLCRRCMGDIFAKLSTKGLGPLAVSISGALMYISMKSMHGKKFEVIPFKYEDYFVETA